MVQKYGAFLCVLLFFLTIRGAEAELRFTRVDYSRGLSQSTVFSIAQDSLGFLWFATEDGLNRFDGYTCTVYRHHPRDTTSLASTGIRKIQVDARGRLWVLALDGKLDRYSPRTDRFYHYQFPPPSAAGGQRIRLAALACDRQGNLWTASTHGQLFRYQPEKDRFLPFSFQSKDGKIPGNIHLQCLYFDREGVIWLGTWEGLYAYQPQSGRFRHYGSDSPESQTALGGKVVFDLCEDTAGNLWIATADGGVSRLNPARTTVTVYRYDPHCQDGLCSDRAVSLRVDSRGNLWIGTVDNGINLLPRGASTFRHYRHNPNNPRSLGNGAVFAIYEDRRGGLWFGTYGGGVSYYDHRAQAFGSLTHDVNNPGSLSHNIVLSICEDHTGALWVGTDGGGVNLRLPGSAVFQHLENQFPRFGSSSVTAIYETRDGTVWLGTDPGMNSPAGLVLRYDRRRGKFRVFSAVQLPFGGVTKFLEDHRGELWIGTSASGLYRYDPASGRLKIYRHNRNDSTSLSGNSIFALYEDRQGVLWIGTHSKGLNRFDRETETFRHYRHRPGDPRSLSDRSVWCIAEDASGTLWFGTWRGGLNRFDRATETFRAFTTEDGLPSNIIYGILPDEQGHLWVSSSRGLTRFDTRNFSLKNYDLSSGLLNGEFNQGACCRGRDGTFYFGGTRGITYFRPEQIEENRLPPPVFLTGFRVLGKSFPLPQSPLFTRKITLTHRQNFFTLEFVALDFTAPEKNQYRYRLEGIDKDWVTAENRHFASYTAVPPGKYLFRVKGSNNDGVWSTREARVTIVVLPPFWQTWWFRMLLLLLLAAALYAFHRYRLNKLLEVERTRLRIARDLHDDISGTITGLIYFSDAIEREVGQRKTPALEKLLRLVHDSAASVQEAMSDIIWSINPENDDWQRLLPKFRRYASDLCESRGIRYTIEIPPRIENKNLDMERRRNLWLIFKEMVTNAVRHSHCSELRIRISLQENTLHLLVEDDGRGFEAAQKSEGNGIQNIYARAKQLPAEVELETAPGRGTRWLLRMKL